MISTADAQSAMRATVSHALAEALILGIEEAAELGSPLTQKQQVALATMSIMSYDKALEACELLEVALPTPPPSRLPREPFDPKIDFPERYTEPGRPI